MPILMFDNEEFLVNLRRDEGLRLQPYRDTVGKLTIGYGRNLDDHGISVGEAEYMLSEDAAEAKIDVVTRLPWVISLDPVRQRVLCEMTFNMGIGGVLTFRETLAAIREGRWDDACNGLLTSLADHQEPHRVTVWATSIREGK